MDQQEIKYHKKTLSCKLTSSALRERKATVISSLRKKLAIKKDIPGGFEYIFPGSDEIIDELVDFIKSERQCCNFFQFNLNISGDTNEVRLSITGPEGSRRFLENELGF